MRAVFLDRDGVLNANIERDGRPVAPWRREDFRILPGVPEAVGELKRAGFVTVVVTNQPDIANGRTQPATLAAMHEELRRHVEIDDIRVCPHVDADACACRKPKPGMIEDAAAEHSVALDQSWLVGDRWRDIAAAHAAGCRSILVGDWDGGSPEGVCPADYRAKSLPDAVQIILQEDRMSVAG
ncbi:D-glycero-alpha-D-manno-heptose-1,7-bisphosphate 7-phosphatase [Bradyrhizobium sp.]|uniref:D-glycero-alpha-D-manno-heptose-1,7-bisphosphate 7-phosphatase n=1 Tax=Bradyrhizobium sp. TaxID=376 RepID=UPI003C4351AF